MCYGLGSSKVLLYEAQRTLEQLLDLAKPLPLPSQLLAKSGLGMKDAG